MNRQTSWYQLNTDTSNGIIETLPPQNIRATESEEISEYGDHPVLAEGDFMEVYSHPLEVTRKNKIVCTVAYLVLILSLVAYIAFMVYVQIKYNDVTNISYISGPLHTIYFIYGIDILLGFIGIWSCLAKTGPYPMIFACCWLLLSSLVNLCATISLVFKGDKSFVKSRVQRCGKGKESSSECQVFYRVVSLIWCSLVFILVKVIVIILCRLNYPQVFNWLVGKNVLVDEDILKAHSADISKVGTFAAAFHDPMDLNILTARGALGGEVRQSENSQTIIITKKDDFEDDTNYDRDKRLSDVGKAKTKRRSTMISLGTGNSR